MRTSRRYLVDIDTLFDTRLGWLYTCWPEEAKKLNLDAYRMRHTELWPEMIGIQGWRDSYNRRDERALKNAMPTEFLLGLKNQLLSDITSVVLSSPYDRPSVTINLWPYTGLTEAEITEFTNHFRVLYEEVKVECVFIPFEQLTPGQLNALFDGWYMYDWFNWINMHAKNLAKGVPEFTVCIPALLTDELTADKIEAIERDGVNPFKALTQALKEYITVDIVDVRRFSIHRPLTESPDSQTPQP